MSATRTIPLVGDVVDELPERCRRCLFWEAGADRPAEDETDDDAADRVRKQGWITAQSLEDGPPGALARNAKRTVGYSLFAPAGVFAPRSTTVPPLSHDALLLATAWVAPTHRGRGVGRLLVRAAVREAIRLDLRAVEAYGDRRARSWDCVLPAAWLLEEGFEVTAEHPRYPLLRIDTNRVARWAESLEHAVEELLGRARPVRAPQPTTSARAETN